MGKMGRWNLGDEASNVGEWGGQARVAPEGAGDREGGGGEASQSQGRAPLQRLQTAPRHLGQSAPRACCAMLACSGTGMLEWVGGVGCEWSVCSLMPYDSHACLSLVWSLPTHAALPPLPPSLARSVRQKSSGKALRRWADWKRNSKAKAAPAAAPGQTAGVGLVFGQRCAFPSDVCARCDVRD